MDQKPISKRLTLQNLQEKNIRTKIRDIGFGNGFLDTTPKTTTTGGNAIWTSEIFFFKDFCAKNTFIKGKKLQNGRKYLQITSHQGLVARIYKEFLQVENKMPKNLIKI